MLLGGHGRLMHWEAFPPFGGLVRLAPGVVELDDPLGGLGQAFLGLRWDLGFAGLHSLVTLHEQRLGLGVFLLAEQAGAEPVARLERVPLVRSLLSLDLQGFAHQWLGLGWPVELDQGEAKSRESGREIRIIRWQALALRDQRLAEEFLGLGELAVFTVQCGQHVLGHKGFEVFRAVYPSIRLQGLLEERFSLGQPFL